MRVLLVEDSTTVVALLKVYISGWRGNVEILHAADGQQGLVLARKATPDLIVSDVHMPLMDGLQLCVLIRANPITAGVPFVLLTCSADPMVEVQARDAGVSAMLRKPVSPAALRAVVDRVLPSPESRELLRPERVS